MNNKCQKCVHYILQYSYLYKTYVDGCDANAADRKNGCKDIYERKDIVKKPVARIKNARNLQKDSGTP